MSKLVIIGASYLQLPLILKAREMGIETHVFAWEKGAVGKKYCDFFYPVSIIEKEKILEISRQINPSGIISIASDLAMNTVNYVANKLGLIGNSLECTEITTDKYKMRLALSARNLPCPRFTVFTLTSFPDLTGWNYPVIVKPTDRSGSRGITKIFNSGQLRTAVDRARMAGYNKTVITEEFIQGREISVEMITWKGTHHFLAFTDKETTGEPYYVETGQYEPADLSEDLEKKIIKLVNSALTSLKIEYGASHSELIITPGEDLYIVEIGARMGGDQIGSHLVQMSTGYDFTKGVIEVAMGNFTMICKPEKKFAGIYYLEPKEGIVEEIIDNTGSFKEVASHEVFVKKGDKVKSPLTSSSERCGYFIYCTPDKKWSINKDTVLRIKTNKD